MFLINYDDKEYEINKKEDLDDVPTEAILYEYNQLTGKDTKKFSSRAKGIDQIWPLIQETMATPTTARRTGEGGRAAPISKEATITVLAGENPKIPGSKSHKRFSLYKTGLTVGAYLEAGGRRADLAWDSEKEYIKIDG